MAKVVTSYANFSKAKLDHDMGGRYDLPIYNTGADVFQNFISNYKGNAIFSSGFVSQVAFQDCAFIEFKFGITQNYLAVFTASAVQFLAFDTDGNFGWVLSGGVPLVVISPYTLADAKTISMKGSYTQNNDVMYMCHRAYAPYKLTRSSSNSFTFAQYTRTSDPFFPTVIDSSTTSNSISTGSKTFTVSTGQNYVAGGAVTFISGINSMRGTVTSYSGSTLVVNITAINGFGTFTSWAVTQLANWPGACVFYQGRLYMASTIALPTTVWMSNSGLYDDFTIQSPITDASGFNFGLVGITQQIEWLFAGDNSLVVGATDGIVAINGGAVNTSITPATVQATLTSAEPTNGVYPIKKEGLIFYISQNQRNMYYFSYDILTQLFIAKDANISSYDVTKGNLNKIRWKRDRNDLIFSLRGDGALASMNFKAIENIIGWHERFTPGTGSDTFNDIAVMGDNLGNPQLFALANRNGTFYIEQQVSYVEFTKRDNFFTGLPDMEPSDLQASEDDDDEAYSRYISEQLRQCVFLDNALTYSDLRASTITYDPIASTITSNASDFSSADVGKHIVYQTDTGYESGRFEITSYVSGTVVEVAVLQTPKGAAQAELFTWSAWYKSFITLSGLSQYNGTEVGLVTDGGYLQSSVISGGTITFDQQTCNVVVGYSYTGVIKTFCLGFQMQGSNTQTTLKNIVRVGVRCVASASGKVGYSRYALQPVQELSQSDYNYLPPLPVDGTKYVDITDDAEEDKFLYAVQDEPLPFEIINLAVEANYAMSS